MGELQTEPFQFTFNGFLKVAFQGSRITSDAGLILVRELDERLGLATLIAEHLSDSRQGLNTQFSLADLLRQSVYSRLAGYEDLNDAVFMHFKAVEAYLKQMGRLPVNMKMVLEGEEEIGSTHLDAFVRDHLGELTADVVVISDSPMFDRGVPSICYGLRGLVYFQLDLRGTASDLHSGSFGGAVANPGFVLSQILSQMKDRSGRVKIPRLLRRRASPARRGAGGPDAATVQRAAVSERSGGAEAVRRARLHDPRAGVGAPHLRDQRPAVRIHRRRCQDRHPGGGDGEGQHASSAGPGPGHHRCVVRGLCAKGDAEVGDAGRDAAAWGQTLDDRDRQPVRAGGGTGNRAGLRPGAGVQPRGCSIPVVSTFQELLGLPTVLFGVGLPDENAHAPNEKLDLGNFHNGIIASTFLYQEIGKLFD